MIPIYIREEMIEVLDKNQGAFQEFIQKASKKNLNRLEIELMLNNFRVNSSLIEAFELLENIKFSIENINVLVFSNVITLKSSFSTSFLEYYDKRIPALNRTLIANIDAVINQKQYEDDKLNNTIDLQANEVLLDNKIEELFYNDNFNNFPFIDVYLSNDEKEKFVFIPTDLLTPEKPFIYINSNDNISKSNFLKLFTETLIAYIGKNDDTSKQLTKNTANFKNFKSYKRILKDYYNVLKNNIKNI